MTHTHDQPAELHYEFGKTLYMDNCPVSDCENAHQDRGWWAALEADADCETAGYLAQANDGDISDDYFDIRAGMQPTHYRENEQ